MENLDLACAELGSALATIGGVEEKLLIDALSVLEEQGPYAFFLYLKARGGKPGGAISQKCYEFLRTHPTERALLRGDERDALAHVRASLADDLDGLLLARDLLRQALIYACYHSRTRGGLRRGR
ncbi:MAG: hypothetical protein QN158_07600 [Armatimonadota bacterium]|nr:hypothetical protein [Armatimonadota bacterium]MDR7502073.1 hypothetical protein [Armatimonadota bacterium]MDR7585442.1 hypothetical protein [Armatimonadota bacterium]